MVTATQVSATIHTLSSFTKPPAVPEATTTTPLYLHAPTRAAAGHGIFAKKNKSENEKKTPRESSRQEKRELTSYRL
jgi:hypothetical protein